MILQVPRQGETRESLQRAVDHLFSEEPLSGGLRRVADRHGSLADPSLSRGGGGRGLFDGLSFFSPLGLLLLFFLLGLGVLLFFRIQKGHWLGTEPSAGEASLPVPQRVTGSTALRGKARAAALAGDHREAIRLLLLSLLTLISERRLLARASNLTTREILSRLPRSEESENRYLAHFFHVFEEASYGGRSVGDAEYVDLDAILGRGIQHELLKGKQQRGSRSA